MEQPVAVALSGGADSAVAAMLLRDAGLDVFGLHAVFGGSVHSTTQVRAARAVARSLGIELRTVDLTVEFRRLVIEPFCIDYARGRTPNPCVVCNESIKFGALLAAALESGAGSLATGHHARTRVTDDGVSLLRAVDSRADQSYFLYRVASTALARAVMPVGEMARDEVCARAVATALPVGRPSRDLCFVHKRGYPCVVAGQTDSSAPGDIIDAAGHVLGRHRGLAHYTVGQRHGLDIARGIPVYVTRLIPERNLVVVGPEDALYAWSAIVTDLAWIAGRPPAHSFRAEVQVRHRAKTTLADVELAVDSARVSFAEPQKAIAPGQSLVMYNGEAVLGGGFLEEPP